MPDSIETLVALAISERKGQIEALVRDLVREAIDRAVAELAREPEQQPPVGVCLVGLHGDSLTSWEAAFEVAVGTRSRRPLSYQAA
jgi:hypothetical protein